MALLLLYMLPGVVVSSVWSIWSVQEPVYLKGTKYFMIITVKPVLLTTPMYTKKIHFN